jgi:hypothetical protein
MALPIKLGIGSGSPTRVLALVSKPLVQGSELVMRRVAQKIEAMIGKLFFFCPRHGSLGTAEYA